LSNDRVVSLWNHYYMLNAVIEGDTSLLNSKHWNCKTASARILLVDDFGPFRELASLLLEKHAGYKIVAEAADGREGVQKARESQPDLVVLDMDLPLFNGIEVARQIRGCCPDSTILFLTGNDDPELVCEALRAGAQGYVLKFDTVVDLVEAAKAVLSGKQFISRRLRERDGRRDF
jgi:two-component system, NarL family, nitrate/nitrite response regulator NarL